MSGSRDDLCVNCNKTKGTEYQVKLTARDGSVKQLNPRLCEECATELNTHDWTTIMTSRQVESPAEKEEE